jgi:hypothetical protein
MVRKLRAQVGYGMQRRSDMGRGEVISICEDEPGETVIGIYACLKDANSRSTLRRENAKRRAVAGIDITSA